MVTLTAGSLFSGVGMMDYAFAQAGFDIRFQVEIEPFCRKVLEKHGPTYWPDSTIYADVRDVRGSQLGYVDVLFGGFPCQSISVAGTRTGIQAGTASGLWLEFARLIGEIQPAAVLLENVAAITGRDGIKVITDLTALGYDCRWGVISASEVGAPHIRERWWCVAFQVGYANSQRHAESQSPSRLCADAERDDSAGISRGIHQLYTALGNGEMEHANGEQRQKQHSSTSRSETGFPGRGSCQDETSSVDNSNSQRLEEIHSTRDGNTPFIGWANAGNGTEREWPPNQPRLDRSPDGPSVRMDRRHGLIVKHQWAAAPNEALSIDEPPRMAPGKPNTNQRIKALGNGAIPQIVYPLALYLKGMMLAGEGK